MRLSSAPDSYLLYKVLLLLGSGSLCDSARIEDRAPASVGTSSTTELTLQPKTNTTSSTLASSLDTSIVVEVLTATIKPLPLGSGATILSDDQAVNLKVKPNDNQPQLSTYLATNGPHDEVIAPLTYSGDKPPAGGLPNKGQQPTKSGANSSPSSVNSKSSSSSTSTNTEDHRKPGGGQNVNKPPNPTTAPATTYTNEQVTITSAPNWGDQKIPINTCTTLVNNREIQWIPCMVFAGTVQLSFFPEAKGNLSYPSTYFDPALGITLTSPSIYMVINTLTAYNPCGRVGPTYKDYIISMDLTDVSTMRPYPDATARDRLGDPRQITLADLATNCPKFSDTPHDQTLIHSSGAIIDEHPIENDWNRCNPRLVMPAQMKSVGLPYWRHCGNDNGHFGIFDPPGAVPPVQGIFPTKAPAPVVPAPVVTAQPSPTISPSPPPTAVPVAPEPQPEPEKPENVQQPSKPTLAPNPIGQPQPSPSNPEIVAPVNQDTPPATPNQSESAPEGPGNQPSNPQNPVDQPGDVAAQEPSVIAIIGTNTINAGSSGIVLPGTPLASVGAVATLTDSNNNGVVVSVASSGVYVGTGASASFIASPTTPPSHQNNAGAPAPVVTYNGEVIHAVPGATTLVIKGQTLTAGGPPVTISGTDNVAIFSNNGLIIQYPGGTASYFPLPTAAPAQLEAQLDGSTVVYEGKTLAVGGPPAFLADNVVASLGPSGLIIQKPSGIESTIPYAQLTGVASAPARNKAEEEDIGGAIADMIGIQAAVPSGEATSSIGSVSVITSLLSTGVPATSSILTTNVNAPAADVTGTVTAALVDKPTPGSPAPEVSTVLPGDETGGNVNANATDVPQNLEASSGTRTVIWGGGCITIALVVILGL